MGYVYCAPVTGQVLRTHKMHEEGWAWTSGHFSFPASLYANLISTSLFPRTEQRAFCTNQELRSGRWQS